MEFASGGAQALTLLEQQPFEVIVTDMRMPGMDGAQLLAQVRERWPTTVRIVLSGHSEREGVMRSLHEAHQYLAKPCDAAVLQATIDRALRLRRLILNRAVVEAVSQLDHLPTLPDLYMEITDAMRNDSLSLPDLGRIVQRDLALSAKILQVVNSAFFALPRHVASPGEAAVVLGVDVLRALVLGAKLFTSIPIAPEAKARLELIWRHSQRHAVLARRVARALGLDRTQQDQAFMGGMLHDVGKLALIAKHQAGFFANLPPESAVQERERHERAMFGATHAEIGAYLIGLWGLPDDIVAAIAWHHSFPAGLTPHRDPATSVHVAECLENGIPPNAAMLAALDGASVYESLRKDLGATEEGT